MFRLRSRGTNALEVIIALAIVSLGLLGVASVYTFGTAASRGSDHASRALRAAERLVEQIRVENMPYQSGFPPAWLSARDGVAQEDEVALNAAPFAATFEADEDLKRQVLMTPDGPNLVRLRVRVGWSLEGRDHWIELQAMHTRP